MLDKNQAIEHFAQKLYQAKYVRNSNATDQTFAPFEALKEIYGESLYYEIQDRAAELYIDSLEDPDRDIAPKRRYLLETVMKRKAKKT